MCECRINCGTRGNSDTVQAAVVYLNIQIVNREHVDACGELGGVCQGRRQHNHDAMHELGINSRAIHTSSQCGSFPVEKYAAMFCQS
jgi:hypothetical protein